MRQALWVLLTAAVLSSSCGETVDLTKGLEVIDVAAGWHDAGIVDGKNKLVPSITFALKNVSHQELSTLQANVVFRRVTEEKEWGAMFVRVTGSEGLAPGAASQPQTVRSPLGYTGTESRQQMLANAQFVDARAEVFVKYGSTQWQLVGAFPVPRTLMTK